MSRFALMAMIATIVLGCLRSVLSAESAPAENCGFQCMYDLAKASRLAQIKQHLVNQLDLPANLEIDSAEMQAALSAVDRDENSWSRSVRSANGAKEFDQDVFTSKIEGNTVYLLNINARSDEDFVLFDIERPFMSSVMEIEVEKPGAEWSGVQVTLYRRIGTDNAVDDDHSRTTKVEFEPEKSQKIIRLIVTEIAQNWYKHPDSNHGAIVHITAIKNGQSETRNDLLMRVILRIVEEDQDAQRGHDCTTKNVQLSDAVDGDCCLHSFVVDFAEFGFNYIISPTSYKANICMGKCSIRSTDTVFSSLVSRLSRMQLELNDITEIVTCCYPTQLAPLYISYYDGTSVFRNKMVKDMIAVDCACG